LTPIVLCAKTLIRIFHGCGTGPILNPNPDSRLDMPGSIGRQFIPSLKTDPKAGGQRRGWVIAFFLVLCLSLTIRLGYTHMGENPAAPRSIGVKPSAPLALDTESLFQNSHGNRERWLAVTTTKPNPDIGIVDQSVNEIGRMHGVYSVIVQREGKTVAEKYFREGFREKPHNLKSASKSLLSALVGIAVDEGLLNLDQPIRELLPYDEIFKDPRKARITVRHLLTMTSGLVPTSYQTYNAWISSKDWVKAALDRPMVAEPGATFQYSTGNTHILSGILTRVTGVSSAVYAERKLFKPLGIQLKGWDTDPNGVPVGGNNLSLLPTDMVKLGQLYLNEGRYGSQQVLPKWWVAESIRPTTYGDHEVYGGYGYLWYTRPGGTAAFTAVGFGGQYIYVSPPDKCVIVITSTLESKGREWEKKLFTSIQDGILGGLRGSVPRDDKPLPTYPETQIAQLPESTDPSTPLQMEGITETGSSTLSARSSASMGRTTANVVLRTLPGPEGTRMELVPLESEVPIFETRNHWHRIRYKQKEGWVSGDYVKITGPIRILSEEDGKLPQKGWTRTRLNLRSGPGKRYAVVETLKSGSPLEINQRRGKWFHVESKGLKGWLHIDYVKLAIPEAPALATALPSEPPETRKEGPEVASRQTDATEQQELAQAPKRPPVSKEVPQATFPDAGIKLLESRIDALQQRLDTHQAAVTRWEATNRKLADASAESRAQLDSLVERLTSMKGQNKNASLERSAMFERVEELGRSLENVQQRIEANIADNETLRRNVTNFSPGFETLRNGLAAALHEISILRMELKAAEKNHVQLKTDLDHQKETVGIQHALVTQSEKSRLTLTKEMTLATDQVRQMELSVQNLVQGQDTLKKNLAGLEKKVADGTTSGDANQKNLKTVNEKLTGLTQNLESAGIERDQIKAGLEAQNKVITGQQTRIGDADKARLAMAGKLTTLEEKIVETALAHDLVKNDFQSINDRINGLVESLESALAERDQLRTELKRQNQAIADQRVEMEKSGKAHLSTDEKLAVLGKKASDAATADMVVQKNLQSINDRIAGMAQSLEASLTDRDRIKAELNSQKQAIADHHAKLTGIEKARLAGDETLAVLQKRLKASIAADDVARKDLAAVSEKTAAMAQSMETARVHLEQLQAGLDAQKQAIADRKTQMDKLDNAHLAADKRLAVLEKKSADAATKVMAVQTNLQTATEKVAGLVQAHEVARGERDQIKAGLNNQNQTIADHHAKLAGIEKAQLAGDETLAVLQKRLKASLSADELARKALTAVSEKTAAIAQSVEANQVHLEQLQAGLDAQKQAIVDRDIQIDNLENARLAADEKLAALTKKVSDAATAGDAVQKNLLAVAQKVTGLAQMIEVAQGQQDLLKAGLTEQNKAIAGQQALLGDAENARLAMDGKLAALEKKVTDAATAGDAVHNTLLAVAQKVTGMSQALEAARAERDEIKAGLSAQEQVLAGQKEEIGRSDSERAAHAGDLAAMRHQMEGLGGTVQTTQTKQGALDASLQKVLGELAALRKEATTATKMATIAREDLTAGNTRDQTLKASIQAIGSENARLKAELQRKNEEIAIQGAVNLQSEKERSSLASDLAAAHVQIRKLEGEMGKAVRGRESAKKALVAIEKKVAALAEIKADKTIIEKERTESIAVMAKLTQSYQDLQTDREKLTSELMKQADLILKQQALMDQLGKAKSALAEELSESRKLMEVLRLAGEKSSRDNSRLNEKLAAMDAEIAALRTAGTTDTAWRDEIKKAVDAEKTERLSLANTIQLMKQERKRFKTELARHREEVAAQQAIATAAKEKQETLARKLTASQEQISRLEKRLLSKEQLRVEKPKGVRQQKAAAIREKETRVSSATTSAPEKKRAEKKTPEKPKSPPSGAKGSVPAFVASWADAWSRQDSDAYLNHYAESFKPKGGRTLPSWRNLRRKRLAKPAFIRVSIDNLVHTLTGAQKARATFVQHYRSNTYKDSVTKTLLLIREGKDWKILREETP